MKNTLLAKTLTASLPGNPQAAYAFISDPDNLSTWHSSFCRALRKENGSLIAESPRGAMPVRFIRNDHALVLDIHLEITEGIELTYAIRLLANGKGSELVWTLIKPEGISDTAFHEHIRWAGNALHALRKTPQELLPPGWGKAGLGVTAVTIDPPPPSSPTRGEDTDSQPLQAPSPAEMSTMPLSGKKLFIGNLAYNWTDDQLRAHFAELGVVTTAEVARFRGRGGRSHGFGFVEMATEAEAQTAIEKLNGGMAGGRQIIVRLAKSQESRPARMTREAPVEPGNERMPRTPMSRQRPERPRRAGSSPRTSERGPSPRRLGGGRPRTAGAGGPYQEQDISNKSGYEIFPRRSPGSAEPSRSSGPAPSGTPREPSPYMDDTGDIENHGHRPPRHRRPDRSR